MGRRPSELVITMIAGVRLIEMTSAERAMRFAVTTLRDDIRREFDSLDDARADFDAEVEASRRDPIVGPYVR